MDQEDIGFTNEDLQILIEQLRQLVKENQNLQIRTDDKFLLRFLFAAKLNVKDSYKRIIDFYKLKNEHGFLFPKFPIESYDAIIDNNTKAILDGRDLDGRCLHLTKLGNVNANLTHFEHMVQFDLLLFEGMMNDPKTLKNGICAIVDLENYSWKLFKWLTPHNVKAATKLLETTPISNLKIHIVNSSFLLNAAVSVVFPFLSKETKEHIYFHSNNWDLLKKHVSAEYLPKEYGGDRTIDCKKLCLEFLEDNKHVMENSLNNKLFDD